MHADDSSSTHPSVRFLTPTAASTPAAAFCSFLSFETSSELFLTFQFFDSWSHVLCAHFLSYLLNLGCGLCLFSHFPSNTLVSLAYCLCILILMRSQLWITVCSAIESRVPSTFSENHITALTPRGPPHFLHSLIISLVLFPSLPGRNSTCICSKTLHPSLSVMKINFLPTLQ